MEQYIPSKLLSNAVDQFAKLPGVGRRTALRLVLELLKRDENSVTAFANSITELKQNIRTCKICGNLSDSETCSICSNHSRNHSLVCVVENVRDIIAIEQSSVLKRTAITEFAPR